MRSWTRLLLWPLRVSLFLCVLPALPVAFFFAPYHAMCCVSHLLLCALGFRVRVEGQDRLVEMTSGKTGRVFVFNHASYFDHMFLMAALQAVRHQEAHAWQSTPLGFVAGARMLPPCVLSVAERRFGYVGVGRDRSCRLCQVFSVSARGHRQIAFSPTADHPVGDGPWRTGAFRLPREVVIVPTSITWTFLHEDPGWSSSGALHMVKKILLKMRDASAVVCVRFLPCIQDSDSLSDGTFEATVQRRMHHVRSELLSDLNMMAQSSDILGNGVDVGACLWLALWTLSISVINNNATSLLVIVICTACTIRAIWKCVHAAGLVNVAHVLSLLLVLHAILIIGF